MRKLLLVVALLAFWGVSASAAPVILTNAQLAGFTLVSSTGSPLPLGNLGLGGYAINWPLTTTGAVQATIGVGSLALGAAGDTFNLTVTNNNGSLWFFEASVNGGLFQGPIPLIPGQAASFSFVLGGALNSVAVRVSQVIPIGPQNDRGAEFRLSQVPEPTSMLLLGTGLVGLAGAVRRRFKATV